MNKRAIIIIVITSIILGLIYGYSTVLRNQQRAEAATLAPSPTPFVSRQDQETRIYSQIAEFRKENGKKPTRTDAKSCAFAIDRAKDLPQSFEHDKFTTKEIRKAYGFYYSAGENLARYISWDRLVQAWIDSPSHREILLGDFDYMCVEWITEGGVNYYALEAYSPE